MYAITLLPFDVNSLNRGAVSYQLSQMAASLLRVKVCALLEVQNLELVAQTDEASKQLLGQIARKLVFLQSHSLQAALLAKKSDEADGTCLVSPPTRIIVQIEVSNFLDLLDAGECKCIEYQLSAHLRVIRPTEAIQAETSQVLSVQRKYLRIHLCQRFSHLRICLRHSRHGKRFEALTVLCYHFERLW